MFRQLTEEQFNYLRKHSRNIDIEIPYTLRHITETSKADIRAYILNFSNVWHENLTYRTTEKMPDVFFIVKHEYADYIRQFLSESDITFTEATEDDYYLL